MRPGADRHDEADMASSLLAFFKLSLWFSDASARRIRLHPYAVALFCRDLLETTTLEVARYREVDANPQTEAVIPQTVNASSISGSPGPDPFAIFFNVWIYLPLAMRSNESRGGSD